MSTGRTLQACSALFLAVLPGVAKSVPPPSYSDGRPQARLRMDALDQGVILRHGDGPGGCDRFGARDSVAFEDHGTTYLYYDGAGPDGWVTSLATSQDLIHWEKRGRIFQLGPPGSPDSAGAISPWVIRVGGWWQMFYLGTPHATPPPDRIPAFPYLTLKARGRSLAGPWEKQYDVRTFVPRPGTYYSATASPGQIVKFDRRFLMFFSGSIADPGPTVGKYARIERTLGIASAANLDGPWTVSSDPIVPLAEQIENSSLYYEPKIQTWFLFTNHIGINEEGKEFTDAVWVYWSRDLLRWNASDKAVVLDGRNCRWSKTVIGMPSVVKFGKRLALFYDGPGGDTISHMNRDIGLAWLTLPLSIPRGGRG